MLEIKNIDDIHDHISRVALCAPDRFPVRNYLAADEQMNLDRAFEQLRRGLVIAYPESHFEEERLELAALLDQSLTAYRAGDRCAGAHLLQDFQDGIFKISWRRCVEV